MANPLRLSVELVEAAERAGLVHKRSVPKQIEFWATLGRAVEKLIDHADVYAVTQGLKKISVEPVDAVSVQPDEIFDALEKSRTDGSLAARVTRAAIYYEASRGRPGLLDQVNSATGERRTGRFHNGEFQVLPE